jgi:hypothetical protein
LKEKDIYYILNVAEGSFNCEPGFTKEIIPISDYGITNLKEVMDVCFEFIKKAAESGNKVRTYYIDNTSHDSFYNIVMRDNTSHDSL